MPSLIQFNSNGFLFVSFSFNRSHSRSFRIHVKRKFIHSFIRDTETNNDEFRPFRFDKTYKQTKHNAQCAADRYFDHNNNHSIKNRNKQKRKHKHMKMANFNESHFDRTIEVCPNRTFTEALMFAIAINITLKLIVRCKSYGIKVAKPVTKMNLSLRIQTSFHRLL